MTSPQPSLREQGRQAMQQRNLPLAVQLLRRAVIADGHDPEARALLGMACSESGYHQEARQALQAAAALQPRNAGFRFQLGLALERSGDPPGAAQAYREALQLNPGFGSARARLQALGTTPAAQPAAVRPPAARPQAPPAAAPPPPAAGGLFPGSWPDRQRPASADLPQAAPGATGSSAAGIPAPLPPVEGGYAHTPAPGNPPPAIL
jgi:tetratricopeptide (TPR) repeat protein